MFELQDDRTVIDFKTCSFSNYKRTHVCSALLNSLVSASSSSGSGGGGVEALHEACFWSAELIAAGHYSDVWDTLLFYYCKHVHIANAKLSIYLQMKFDYFKQLMNSDDIISELDARNNQQIRQTIAEVVCVLALSTILPGTTVDNIKLDHSSDMNFSVLTNKLLAPTDEFIKPIFQEKDPKELFAVLNELAFSLQQTHTTTTSNISASKASAWHWIEWIHQFDVYLKKKHQPLQIARRTRMPVDAKHQRDVVWIVWDVLFDSMKRRKKDTPEESLMVRIFDALLTLFCLQYSSTTFKKRIFLLYFAAAIVIETPNLSVSIVAPADRTLIQTEVLQHLDTLVYSRIKQQEQTGGLLSKTATTPLERSINKLKRVQLILNSAESDCKN